MAGKQEHAGEHQGAVGRGYPLEMKLRVGAQLAAGLPRGGVKLLAQSLGVSVRTLLAWKKLFLLPEAQRPKLGRPRLPEEVRARMRSMVIAVADVLGWQVSGRAIHRAIDKVVSLALVEEARRVVLAERARQERRQSEQGRVHVDVLARDAIWSLDATHLGRDRRDGEVKAELVRDVASTKTKGLSVGPPANSREVVLLLESVRRETDSCPLVLASDNGSENKGEVESWCEQHGVVRLWNLPHTPQHNPWVEHGNGEIKQQSGLGKGKRIPSVGMAAAAILVALDQIDGATPRTSRGERTAREAYEELPVADALVDRAAFVREAHCAISQAVQGCRSARERRLAERKALLATLERYGLVTQTRGRMPQPDGKPERLS
ncbi:MAG TPA: hypothetical protein VFZ61_11450 [Polyangiales bacterium]